MATQTRETEGVQHMEMQEPINHPLARANGGLPSVGEMTTQPITAVPVAVPRDEAKVLRKLAVRAAMAGEDWFYRFPVRDKGAQKYIEGPSIKCANNVAQLFGNCAIRTRAIDNFDSWLIYARLEDYEQGFVYERPWLQPKGQQSLGTRDQGRAEAIAFQIGVSKAIRNVVCNALELFTNYAFEEARNSIVEKLGKNLPEAINKIKNKLGQMGVEAKRVEAMIGRSIDQWLAPDCARVIAEITAITEGMATADETWPTQEPKPTRESVKKDKETKTTPAPVSAVTPSDRAHQAPVPERAGAPEGGITVGSNEGETATTQTDPVYELYDHNGEQESEAPAKIWALKLVGLCDANPDQRGNLISANEHAFEVILADLDKTDAGGAAKLRALIDADKADAEGPEPERAAVKDPAKPQPILMPKTPGGAMDVSAYIKAINLEIGECKSIEQVRSVLEREKPNRELLKPGPAKILISRAAQWARDNGVKNEPDWN